MSDIFRSTDDSPLDGVEIKILIVVPNYWAKGDTISNAWKNLRGIAGKNLRDLKAGSWQMYVCFDTEAVKTSLDEYGFNFSYPAGWKLKLIETHSA